MAVCPSLFYAGGVQFPGSTEKKQAVGKEETNQGLYGDSIDSISFCAALSCFRFCCRSVGGSGRKALFRLVCRALGDVHMDMDGNYIFRRCCLCDCGAGQLWMCQFFVLLP